MWWYDWGMKKQTDWLGNPVYVWRTEKPVFILGIVLGGCVFGLQFLIEMVGLEMLYMVANQVISFDLMFFVILYTLFMTVPFLMFFLFAFWSTIKQMMFKRRFKKLHGRVCFVCGYEIGEGLEQCSECGALWSLDGLNRLWRKAAAGKGNKSKKEGG